MWKRSSGVVRASGCRMRKSQQQSWVRSQHPPTQWNLRAADDAVLNSVDAKKFVKFSLKKKTSKMLDLPSIKILPSDLDPKPKLSWSLDQ
jgi:hypothetical protein